MDIFEIFALCALPVLIILIILIFLLERSLRRERRRSYLLYMVSEKLKYSAFAISKETHPGSYNHTAEKLSSAIYSSYMDARKILDSQKIK